MHDSYTIAALKFISWIKEMNRSMNIPRFIDGIHDKDISTMAKHAAAESNPLYPVPKLMNRKELENMYYIIGGKHLKLLTQEAPHEVSDHAIDYVTLELSVYALYATAGRGSGCR